VKMHWQNLKYLLKHKWYVFRMGLKFRVWWHQLIIHDWTKLLPVEWFGYARFFFGQQNNRGRSISSVMKEVDPRVKEAFQRAWNHHQKHNPHHWQYWVVLKDGGHLEALEMPERFVREMLADWAGASLAIKGVDDTPNWYQANRGGMVMHKNTTKLVEELLKLPEGQRTIFVSYTVENK